MSIQAEHEIKLAKRIEAGLLAQEMLEAGEPGQASDEELTVLAEEGRQAKEELILSHLGLVKIIALESAKYGKVPLADLFQEGCVGLQQAVMRYDWRKGPFGPYAGMWIRAAVRRTTSHGWVPIDEVEVEDHSVTHHHENTATHNGLAQVLQLVPAREREVLLLRSGWDGQPQSRKAIASNLGLTVAKVRNLEKAGIETMREQWELAVAA